MTVVLKMAGDPVAVVRSRAPGKQLPEGEKARIENELGARHDAIKGDIRAHGATVLADLKDAYNGMWTPPSAASTRFAACSTW